MAEPNKEVVTITPDPFVDMVERLATNEAVDPDKMQKLVDLQMQIMDRNARDAFYNAMNLVQAGLPTVAKDALNKQTSSMYAKLETVARAIKPVYTSEGFSASFWEGKTEKEDYIRIEGVLRHREGHSEPYSLELPLDMAGIKGNVNKTRIHASGSTFTYGRRYLTCMMFDVATGDDNDAQQPVETISEDQANDLTALINEIGLTPTRKKAFFKWAKIETVEQMPLADFDFACKYLRKIGEEE